MIRLKFVCGIDVVVKTKFEVGNVGAEKRRVEVIGL